MAPGPSIRLLLCLLLAGAALSAAARQPAMMDANGGGACPVDTDADTEAEPVRTDKRAATPAPARTAPARRSGEGEATARPPRWHSFLPGMIR